MQVWNVLLAVRCKYRTQKSRQKSPSGHHRTTSTGDIFATRARIDNRKKSLSSSNTSSTCPYNMVNFGTLAAEILSSVWGTPGNFNWFRVLAPLLHGICSAGRPSRWALAHILVMVALCNRAVHYICALWFLSSFFFPRLISAVADWMSTILPHMVWS